MCLAALNGRISENTRMGKKFFFWMYLHNIRFWGSSKDKSSYCVWVMKTCCAWFTCLCTHLEGVKVMGEIRAFKVIGFSICFPWYFLLIVFYWCNDLQKQAEHYIFLGAVESKTRIFISMFLELSPEHAIQRKTVLLLALKQKDLCKSLLDD